MSVKEISAPGTGYFFIESAGIVSVKVYIYELRRNNRAIAVTAVTVYQNDTPGRGFAAGTAFFGVKFAVQYIHEQKTVVCIGRPGLCIIFGCIKMAEPDHVV